MPPLTLAEKQDVLRRCLDLAGLDAGDLAQLAERAMERVYRAGEVICEEDHEVEDVALAAVPTVASSAASARGPGRGQALYVIADGLVSVTQRSEERRAPIIFTLGAGGLFGESALSGGLLGAEAYRRTRLLVLDHATIGWARRALPSFGAVGRRLARIYREMPWIVDRLRRSPFLRQVPPRYLYEMLEGATIEHVGTDAALVRAGESPRALRLVLDGELVLVEPQADRTLHVLGRGSVIGDLELMSSAAAPYDVLGAEPSEVLRIDYARVHDLIDRSSTFRRSLLASRAGRAEQRRPLVEQVLAREDRARNLVAVVGDDPRLPLGQLVEWLAEAAAREFGDQVMVLRLDERAGEVPEIAAAPSGPGGIVRARVNPRSPSLREGVLAHHSTAAQYVLLDVSAIAPAQIAAQLESVERAVFVASRPYRSLPAELLDRLARPPLYTAVIPAEPQPDGAEPRVPPATARIHRDLVEAGRRAIPYERLDARLRRQVHRWSRAVTNRRVGIALGGGGAFGYAHLPLLRRIEEAGIPIDLVSGASVGAAVGAWYAVRGLDGLDDFLRRGARTLYTTGLVSTRAIARFVDDLLGGVRLEDLEVPFYPVVVDIDAACQMTLRHGTVGFGVRASASFPGLYTPALLERRDLAGRARVLRLVDGGVINIVPDDVLYMEGAAVALASNVIPPPRARRRTSARWLQRWQSLVDRVAGAAGLVRELDPLVRIDDSLRTMYIMMHAPLDWESRTAEAKFRATPGSYSPLAWNDGAAIAAAQDPEAIDRAVEQLRESYLALRWTRPGGR